MANTVLRKIMIELDLNNSMKMCILNIIEIREYIFTSEKVEPFLNTKIEAFSFIFLEPVTDTLLQNANRAC
jgi:hypothetical protein